MPLMIEIRKGRHCPVAVCDHCGKKIARAKDGNYQWLMGPADRFPAQLFFTHKACCHPFEASRPGFWGSMELKCLPVFLVNNLSVTWESAKALASLMASL